jgi:hypothetical protein
MTIVTSDHVDILTRKCLVGNNERERQLFIKADSEGNNVLYSMFTYSQSNISHHDNHSPDQPFSPTKEKTMLKGV